MSRDSSGVYTNALPDVVAGDVIEASWANTTIDDIGAEIQDSLSRSGKGNMSAALKVIAGTVSAPGLSFTSEANSGLYRASAGDIRMSVGSAEVWRVTSAGLRVASENFIVGTAGKGIDYTVQTPTAATGATTTAEILNHYEVGTWTPTLLDPSLDPSEGQTYTAQVGHYTRIGNRVFIDGQLVMSGLGTLTAGSAASIGGLPFTAAASPVIVSTLSVGFGSLLNLSAAYPVSGRIAASTAYISLLLWDATTGPSQLLVSEVSADGNLYFSGCYRV